MYRVFVSTDLGGDPDDIQSLVHLLHYSDLLRIEGMISTAGPASTPRAELIRQWVRHTDLEALRGRGTPELMREAEVLAGVRQGATAARAPGPGGATEGSRWLAERANAPDPEGLDRPLWVLVWGSMTDLAQALHDSPEIAGKIRVYAIGSSNTTNDPASRDFVYEGMGERWPKLWWIENGRLPRFSHDTFRGCYQGGEQGGPWGNAAFIPAVIRGRGTRRGGLFAEKLGDAFPTAGWPEGTLKEGDTPSFLYLLSPVVGGVGNVDDPSAESWGGQFRRPAPELYPNYYSDLDAPAEVCQATISKWRRAYLGDWEQRWRRYGG